eukprot:TRINITY_DN41977_c0_g1_i1.p1 TRINITY_DN41977_c0_g1~~TRINITY_DN41977_c0_g1_i1.p1  ORF type:complete len:216 (+),score=83.80 TRINITY_DN41977_c0_g1_i1:2-649(+)
MDFGSIIQFGAIILVMKNVDFNDDDTFQMAIQACIVVAVALATILFIVKNKIEAKNDQEKITVAPAKQPFQETTDEEPVEMTVCQHDLDALQREVKQLLTGALISGSICYFFDVRTVVGIQAITVPLRICQSSVVMVHMFGRPAEGKQARPWTEKSPLSGLFGSDKIDENTEKLKARSESIGSAKVTELADEEIVEEDTQEEVENEGIPIMKENE